MLAHLKRCILGHPIGKTPEEAKGLQRLLTQNLPIIHYSTNLPGLDARVEEILCDARAILAQPRLLAIDPSDEVSEPPAKILRKSGSGRPKGKRYCSLLARRER